MIPTGPVTSDVLSLGGDHKFTHLPNSTVRCRLGDVVQVVGAYNQCPVVRFTRR